MEYHVNRFTFRNYRNVGIEKEEELIINKSLNDEKYDQYGDLIILIGANNSGKSNIIDGIFKFSNRKIDSQRDKTNISFDDNYEQITITYEDYFYKFINKNNMVQSIVVNQTINSSFNNLKMQFLDIAKENYSSIEYDTLSKKIDSWSQNDFFDFLDNINLPPPPTGGIERPQDIYVNFKGNNYKTIYLYDYDDFLMQCNDLRASNSNEINNIPFRTIVYTDKQEFKNSDLSIVISEFNFNDNILWKNLFQKINYDTKKLVSAMRTGLEQNNYAFQEDKEKEINNLIENKINKEFNELYTFGKNRYEFKTKILKNEMVLTIREDTKGATLEYQSTGFKWFFSLYFNNIFNYLSPGDILVMDEPGIHLHANGQAELRKFLKELAKEKNITIVISTHSPFMVDLDNLDEIRCISKADGIVSIHNNFSLIDSTDNSGGDDVLNSIKEALTISKNVLFKEKSKLYFVEGTTDYNYLTAIKQLFGKEYEYLNFIPINGLGKWPQHENVLVKLTKMWKNPSIIVDSDNAGKDIEKIVGNTDSKFKNIKVIKLSRADETFTTIESLFTENDANKIFKDDAGNAIKAFENSSVFKKYIHEIGIEEETKMNFKKLFDYLLTL